MPDGIPATIALQTELGLKGALCLNSKPGGDAIQLRLFSGPECSLISAPRSRYGYNRQQDGLEDFDQLTLAGMSRVLFAKMMRYLDI